MDNSIYPQPNFRAHRRGVAAADTTNLATLAAEPGGTRRAANAKGWDTLVGYVEAPAGGVTLQPLAVVKAEDGTQKYVALGAQLGPFADGDDFVVENVHGGRVFMRVHAMAAGTLSIFLTGGVRANEGSV
jgi:hypothetical protein